MTQPRVVIIGAGMAGASLAWSLARDADVLLLEAEEMAGYHTTGRSAAFFAETYGGPQIQPLTSASKAFLFHPPADFTEGPLVRPRGALYVARKDQRDRIAPMLAAYAALGGNIGEAPPELIGHLAPMLRAEWCAGGVYDPDCKDIDVAALHLAYLSGARRHGGRLVTSARVDAVRRSGGQWQLDSTAGQFSADILVNAAGAWADEVAVLAGAKAAGLVPRRRTIVAFEPRPGGVDPAAPLVLDIDDTFYFKPDGHRIWASPGDETPSPPCDSQPDDLDKAVTVDRIEAATHWRINRIDRAWSGLRTFAPDRAPLFGYDPAIDGFFWCAGQGGFGIQTAPAAAMLCAALLLNRPIPSALTSAGVDAASFTPARFSQL